MSRPSLRVGADRLLRRAAMSGLSRAEVRRPEQGRAADRRVSVVIPCYNYGHLLDACVRSVLDQPGVRTDVLIVDDASPDGSAEVARRIAATHPQVRALCREHNLGHIATYNEGLALVDGDYVVLLSADDLLAPGSLQRAVELMEAVPAVGLVYGRADDFVDTPAEQAGDRATSWTLWRGQDWLQDRCRTGRNAIRSCEAVMRTSVLRQVGGGYLPQLPHTADFDLWMRAARVSDVGYVGGVVQAFYRVHGANMHTAQFSQGNPDGTIIDLRERLACFDHALGAGENLPSDRGLLDRAHRTLAREALTLAVRSYDWGVAAEWPVQELVAFADSLCPPAELAGLHSALALRRRVGPERARRHPLCLPGAQQYKVRTRLVRWRWRQAGV